jgi:hypothetical protein
MAYSITKINIETFGYKLYKNYLSRCIELVLALIQLFSLLCKVGILLVRFLVNMRVFLE